MMGMDVVNPLEKYYFLFSYLQKMKIDNTKPESLLKIFKFFHIIIEGVIDNARTYTVKIYRKLKPTIGMITYRNTVL